MIGRALSIPLAALTVAAAIQEPALAHGKFPPDTLANLQVLPKTSTAAEVIGVMRGFAQGLGVRCQFCHIGKEGMPLEQFDFVSDTNEKKRTARAMLRLVQTVNAELGKAVPTAGANPVTCFTCHRGAERPVHAPAAAKPGGGP